MRDYNDNGAFDGNTGQYKKQENNTGLIVLVSVLACLLVVAIITAIIICTAVLKGDNGENSEEENVIIESVNPEDTQLNQEKPKVIKQAVPVGKYMYIGNCNVSVTLRTGPGTDFGEVCQIGVGEEVYVEEYTTDDFAKVYYNNKDGYVMRKYVVTTQPQVWDYDEREVEMFVANSLKGFVNGINTGDSSYASVYYAGDELTQEIKTRESIDNNVLTEEILTLNCHSVKRVSPSQVSCIRDSVIRVTYNDGTVKDVTEKYKYIVDLSSGSMKIVDIIKQ